MTNITITISVAELNALTTAALKAERLWLSLKTAEESCRRKREELCRLQTKYKNLIKTISNSGELGNLQTTQTNADAKTDAKLLTIKSEGCVSGGERTGSEIEV